MNQQEKTQKTRERILTAAILEFGNKSYDASSINNICETGQISKGLLYHNFKGKDDLYLHCVRICYDQLTDYLLAQPLDPQDPRGNFQRLLDCRQQFFSEHPCYANIFFNAVLQPPKHLVNQLADARRHFDDCVHQFYLDLLGSLTLRDGISRGAAMEYISLCLEAFNGYFRRKADQNGSYQDLIQDHEGKLSRVFDIMLYGLAKED